MRTTASIALVLLSLNAALCLGRVVRRGSLADRVIALDLLLLVVVQGVAINTFSSGRAFLDVMVIIALIAFIGTMTMARYIEGRGG